MKDLIIGIAASILATIIVNLALHAFRRMIGWSQTRVRLVSIAAGLVFALIAAAVIGYNLRAAQHADGEVATQQTTAEPVIVPATPSAVPDAASPQASASPESTTPVPLPSANGQGGASTPQPIMTEAPPTFVDVDNGLAHGATVAALRAYLASQPELLNDRNVVLGYVDHVFFASETSPCPNGQVSEFDEHRSYDAWVQRIRRELPHWRDDVPLSFRATLGTYDFQRRVLPLLLNPQGLLVFAPMGYRHCSFTVPVQPPFSYNDYYQIAPGVVPQSLAVSPERGEQILNLAGGHNVTVAMHGAIKSIDPHFAVNGASGYGISYQPTEVTIRSGMIPIYHAMVRAEK
ncbi:MAG TPA: hypothetical protein VHS78_09820 [Candidatus Elarobacter sp.]|jgi:hypothetical protein|nr:hypothetical protein [Candidatus Elarobacter sp.]